MRALGFMLQPNLRSLKLNNLQPIQAQLSKKTIPRPLMDKRFPC